MGLYKYLVILIAIAACACCASGPAYIPSYSYSARPLIPEMWYEWIYYEARNCVENFGDVTREGDISYKNIQWLVMPSEALPGVAGLWSAPNRIYLDASYTMNVTVVQHEILHYLLGGGTFAHNEPAFIFCLDNVQDPNTRSNRNNR